MEQSLMIQIVVPVFDESEALPHFHSELIGVLNGFPALKFSILYIDDGSSDDSFEVIMRLRRSCGFRVECIKFVRNFGKEAALTCGLNYSADYNAVVCIDADSQHPVEVLEKGLRSFCENKLDIRFRRCSRRVSSPVYIFMGWIYSRIMKLLKVDFEDGTTDFGIYSQATIVAFNRLTERTRTFRQLINWIGAKSEEIEFHPNPRLAGSTKFNYNKLIKLALLSLVSYTPNFLLSIFLVNILVILTLGIVVLTVQPSGQHAIITYIMIFLVNVIQFIQLLYHHLTLREVQNRPIYLIEYKSFQ